MRFLNLAGKYYLNLDSYSQFTRSFEFYRPVTWWNYLKKEVVKGGYPLFKHILKGREKREVFSALELEDILDVEGKFGRFNGIYVPPGSGKIIIQVADVFGKIKGYLKVAYNEKGKIQVENEVRMLGLLKEKGVDAFAYPEILGKEVINGKILIFLSAPLKYRKPLNFKINEVKDLADKIFNVETRVEKFENSEFLKDIERKVVDSNFRDEFKPVLEEIKGALKGSDITTGLIHGDFKIWNVYALPDGRFYVIDWEWSRRFGPPMFDLWTWVIVGGMLRGTMVGGKEISGLNLNFKAPFFKLFIIDTFTKNEIFGQTTQSVPSLIYQYLKNDN